jgi:hypothetical protein
MNGPKNTDFADRLSAAANAKKAQLERAARARSAAESPAAVERRSARRAELLCLRLGHGHRAGARWPMASGETERPVIPGPHAGFSYYWPIAARSNWLEFVGKQPESGESK